MTAQEYKPGERLRVTLDVEARHTKGGVLHVSHGEYPNYSVLLIPLDQPGVTIERLVPAEGMPKPGELWESQAYGRMFVIEDRLYGIALSDGKRVFPLEDVLAQGPVTPIYREQPAPEAAKDFPADDEPETVPIAGVAPGTIVSSPEWNAGKPVRIREINELGANQVEARWEGLTGGIGCVCVAENYPVVMVEEPGR